MKRNNERGEKKDCGLYESEPAPSYFPDQRKDATPWARLVSSILTLRNAILLKKVLGKKKKQEFLRNNVDLEDWNERTER